MLVETRALTGLDEEMLKCNCPVHFGGYVTPEPSGHLTPSGVILTEDTRTGPEKRRTSKEEHAFVGYIDGEDEWYRS